MDILVHPALIYLIGALLVPLTKGRVKKTILLLTPAIALVDVFTIKAPVAAWQFSMLDFQITMFYADKLAMLMGYIFAITGLTCILYALNVEDDIQNIISLLYVGSALGIVYAGDIFSFLFFWEIGAMTGAGLVFTSRNSKGIGAGFRYLLMHVTGGAVMMVGLLMHFNATGSIAMGPIIGGIPYAFVLFGVGMNAAFLLIHTWLPDAYPSAPFTASTFLCIFTTKSAVYALARFFPNPSMFIAYMGGLMAVFGATFALMQGNGRKLLSYHVISQVGYMVAGVGIGTAIAVNGAFFHVFNHILYKSLLFMGMGAVIYRTGIEDLSELGGLARKMPITTISVVVAAASISGVPLFNGFNSKGLIFAGAHHIPGVSILLEVAAVGTFLSFLKFTYYGFLRKRKEPLDVSDPPMNMKISMIIEAIMCVVIGVYPAVMLGILPFNTPFEYYNLEHVISTILLLGTTALVFWIWRSSFSPHKWIIRDVDYLYWAFLKPLMHIIKIPQYRFDGKFLDLNGSVIPVKKPAPVKAGELPPWKIHHPEPSEMVTENFMPQGQAVSNFDLKVVDRVVNEAGKNTWTVSRNTNSFDMTVVDGIVNGIAEELHRYGDLFRRAVTGFVDDYAAGVVIGAIILWVLIIIGAL